MAMMRFTRLLNKSGLTMVSLAKKAAIGLLVVEIALSLVVIALMSSAQGCGRGVVSGTMTREELSSAATEEGTDDLCELADAMMAASNRGDTVQAERLAKILEEAMGLPTDGTKEEKR